MKKQNLRPSIFYNIRKSISQLFLTNNLASLSQKTIFLVIAMMLLQVATSYAQLQQKPDKATEERVRQTLKKNAQTLRFMENKGQIASDKVLYYFQGTNG